LVIVSEVSSEERDASARCLAAGLVKFCGAPDEDVALRAAEEEIAFAQTLCDHPIGTLLGLLRRVEGNNVRESFRTLHRRADQLSPAVAFELVSVEDDRNSIEEVDLGELIKRLEK